MTVNPCRSAALALATACLALAMPGLPAAQEAAGRGDRLSVPALNGFAPPQPDAPLAQRGGELTLVAKLTADGAEISRGLAWRIFRPAPGPDGKLPMVASAQGGSTRLELEPGSYLVHVAFGRAGATKRITVGAEPRQETLVLDAGGLKLDAQIAGGAQIRSDQLRFAIYQAGEKGDDEGALIAPDISPNTVVRLNSGVYHVVSTYGGVNAVIRSDIRVEAGKLTEATVEHRAAEVSLKLVREPGGEAIADTSWSILTESGDPVRESVGPFASMVLAEGSYTAVAKNRDRIYQRDFTVQAGRRRDVEVLLSDEQQDGVTD